MAIVPALDLRDQRTENTLSQLPYNIEAEQACLGALLYDPECIHNVPQRLRPETFYEPFHQRLFAAIQSSASLGLLPDAIALSEEFRADKAFKELGGIRYLADLTDRAPPGANMPDYAEAIIELAARRALIHMGQRLAADADKITMADGGATALIAEAERELLQMQLTDRRMELVTSAEAAARVEAWVDNREERTGVMSGLPPLDLQLGPMQPGDLVLIGGRPSMGKSALASHVATRIAAPQWWATIEHGKMIELDSRELAKLPRPKGIIELNGEMSVEQMARRHISDIGFEMFGARFPTYKQIRDKAVSVEQRQMMRGAAQVFGQMPIVSLKRTGLTLSQIRSIVRRQTSKWAKEDIELGAVVIDHVGLTRPEGRVSGRYEAQMEIAIGAKELADEGIGCVLLALIQLSRDVERRDNKRPQLSDLRDAGGWEENADTVLFPYRDAYYAARETEPDQGDLLKWAEWDKRRKSKTMEVIIAKLREGEAGQVAELWGGMAWNAIRGIEPDWGDLI